MGHSKDEVIVDTTQQPVEADSYTLDLSTANHSADSDEEIVKSELTISLSPRRDDGPKIQRNISRVEKCIGGESPLEEVKGGVEMTAVMEAMAAVAAAEPHVVEEPVVAEPVVAEPVVAEPVVAEAVAVEPVAE